jgi:gamma-glutamyltranspeptidase/glutathione hydrolase
MWKGGTAVAAARAAAAVMAICEPVSNGLGSDSFAILWDGKELHGLNASGPAPAAWTPEHFKRKYGDDARTPPKRGFDSATVPGAVASWVALSERFGKLPFADLLEPAIDIAERGYLLPIVVQQKWAAATPELHNMPGFAESFLPWGRAPEVGELFQFKAAARGLRAIAQTKGAAFYGGEIAQAIEKFSAMNGGGHTARDFAHYKPEWVKPLARDYRGYTLHEIPPNGQGIAALIALGILEKFDIAGLPVDGPDAQHLQIEAMKLAFADTYRWVADARHMTEVTAADLLSDAYLSERAKLIDPTRAVDCQHGTPPKGGTIYLTAADESGMMISLIQSNYMGFGSGIVVPGTGVSLQNRGHGFTLDETHPNVVAGGKRPFHTIIPGFLTRDGQPQMSFGVMGGNMQPQGHLQTLVRILTHHQQPQAACDAPRWKVGTGLSVDFESTMAPQLVADLKALGHRFEATADSYMDYGSGQFIWKLSDDLEDGYVAASDSRRDGQAAGY